MPALLDRILAVLPQTQCTRCGFTDCKAYAYAIASTEEPINQCPPGGQEGIERLARVTGQAALPLNPAFGQETSRKVAVIDEAWCIGCTLCIKACPTDAIIGASKFMHTVLEAYCTGCALCLPPCPVDCIQMVATSCTATGWAAWSAEQAGQARIRYEQHGKRYAQQHADTVSPTKSMHTATRQEIGSSVQPASNQNSDKRQAAAQAALARARAKRAAAPPA